MCYSHAVYTKGARQYGHSVGVHLGQTMSVRGWPGLEHSKKDCAVWYYEVLKTQQRHGGSMDRVLCVNYGVAKNMFSDRIML